MTAPRVRRYTTVFASLAFATASAAQSERAFGQLEPGQTVIEINQADPFYDNSWSPVISRVEDTEAADQGTTPESDQSSQTQPIPNVQPIGGFLTPELIEARQTQVDLASQARAEKLAEERAALTPAPKQAPSSLRTEFATNEQQPIGMPANTDGPVSETDSATTPSTNWLRDQFKSQNPAVQTMIALGLVILLIYVLAWTYRKLSANQGGVAGLNAGRAPSGLLEVLGRYPMGNKQSLVLLKFDRRVLLLSQGPSGKGSVEMKTLCELTEPEDVASVLIKVRDADGDSLNKVFKSAMSQAELGSGGKAGNAGVWAGGQPERVIETKPTKRAAPKPAAEVMPGHHDPFSGFGGGTIGPTRQVKSNTDGDRVELWSDPATPPTETPATGNDPVVALRERLEAMRRGERVK